MSALTLTRHVLSGRGYRNVRVVLAEWKLCVKKATIWFVWFIWLVWSIWFIWLNETNQMNQINQTNQTNQRTVFLGRREELDDHGPVHAFRGRPDLGEL